MSCEADCGSCPTGCDPCVEGPALDPLCDPCVILVCAVNQDCCNVAWDFVCANVLAPASCGC